MDFSYTSPEEQIAKRNQLVELTKEPLTLLSDITNDVKYFFGQDVEIEEDVQRDVLDTEISQKVLSYVLSVAPDWTYEHEFLHEELQRIRDKFKEEEGIKPKLTMWAIRGALTGRTRGADMGGIIEILGKDRVVSRIEKAVK